MDSMKNAPTGAFSIANTQSIKRDKQKVRKHP